LASTEQASGSPTGDWTARTPSSASSASRVATHTTRRDGIITTSVVNAALNKVVAAEDAHYATLWQSLTLTQRRVVTAVAHQPDAQVFGEAFRREHRLGSASSVQTAIERLVECEIVDGSSTRGYSVPGVFFRAWLDHAVH
jgi:hypothetical protein